MRRKPEEMNAADREISLLIRSKFGILSVNSFEESRVLRQLERIRDDIVERRWKETETGLSSNANVEAERAGIFREHQILRWTITGGLVHWSNYVRDKSGEKLRKSCPVAIASVDTQNPIQLMKYLSNPPETEGNEVNLRSAIIAFCDLHHWLDREDRAGRFNHILVRALRDISQEQKTRRAPGCIILLSPRPAIPSELVKEIQMIEYPLPTVDQLEKAFLDQIPAIQEASGRKHGINPGECVVLTDEERRKLVQALSGLTYDEAENVIAKSLANDGKITSADIAVALEEKRQIIRKDGMLEYFDSEVSLKDVGGLDLLIRWLDARRDAFMGKKFSYLGQEVGLPMPKGVLLIGVPGGGKSLVCKGIARDWNLPLLRMDIGRVFGRYIGESEENIRRAMKVAESVSPAILWLDEIEKAFPKTTGAGDSGTALRVLNTFLTWLQEKRAAVFVVATGNDIEQIPAELTRKGRFDEIFYVPLPGEVARGQILKIHTRNSPLSAEEYETLAKRSKRFTGAEIEQAITNAWYLLPGLLGPGSGKPADPEEPEGALARAIYLGMKAMVPLANRKNAKGDFLLAETLLRAKAMATPASSDPENLLDTSSDAAKREERW